MDMAEPVRVHVAECTHCDVFTDLSDIHKVLCMFSCVCSAFKKNVID